MLVQKYYFIFYVFIWQILFIDFFHIYNSTKKNGNTFCVFWQASSKEDAEKQFKSSLLSCLFFVDTKLLQPWSLVTFFKCWNDSGRNWKWIKTSNVQRKILAYLQKTWHLIHWKQNIKKKGVTLFRICCVRSWVIKLGYTVKHVLFLKSINFFLFFFPFCSFRYDPR